MKFGEKLKALRIEQGLTHKAVADALDVSSRLVQYYEAGTSYPAKREVYQKLADLFQVDRNYFLTEDEEFLAEVSIKYGRRGVNQTQAVLEQASVLFAGGGLSDEDKLAFLHEIQALYFDSKERAKKFTPHSGHKRQNKDGKASTAGSL